MDSRSFANLTLGKTGQLAQGPLPRARPLSRPSARTLAARPIVARRSRDYRLVNTVNLNVTGWDNFSGHLHYPRKPMAPKIDGINAIRSKSPHSTA